MVVLDQVEYDAKSIQVWLEYLRKLFAKYEWLANSFVLDHFVNNHWESLPVSWQEFLSQLSPEDFSHWISTGGVKSASCTISPPPLSLQSLRRSTQVLSLRRDAQVQEETADMGIEDKVLKLLVRHVKPKKQHEVRRMSSLIQELAAECGGVNNLVDIGSGLGHLCRFLSYGLGFNTIGVDADSTLGVNAVTFNEEIEKKLRKRSAKDQVDEAKDNIPLSRHVNKFLEAGDRICHESEFGLVGLHGCGDLGGIVVQNFVQNPQARFLAFASCCYMKLKECYPLSQFLKSNPIELKYEALELSCHAKELYTERLRNPDEVDKLKTHCYRATLETILVKYGLVKVGLRTVKNNHLMDFNEYALKATEKLHINIRNDLETMQNEIESKLKDWMKVVYFYTLRVMIAPVIETIVLLDRTLFVLENGYKCTLIPLFDPEKSPRNIVIVARK